MIEPREWMYIDTSSAACVTKGPVPTTILSRLLDKSLGVSGETLVWKNGMEKWLRMAEVTKIYTSQSMMHSNKSCLRSMNFLV